MIDEAISRIEYMEKLFDSVKSYVNTDPLAALSDNDFRKKLGILARYYEGGCWLKDYEFDEKGRLPENLKRGILSQDEFYDFLVEMEKLLKFLRIDSYLSLW